MSPDDGTQRLTDTQVRVLSFIRDYQRTERVSPSLSDICKGLRIKNLNSACQTVRQLERDGFIERDYKWRILFPVEWFSLGSQPETH